MGGRVMVPKFRAWDKEENIWIKISSLEFEEGEMWYLAPLMDGFNPVYYESELGKNWELMQSTGMHDKNGVEIFESDILIYTAKSVNYSDTYWHSYCEVFRAPNGAYRIRGEHIYETDLYSNRNHVTVAGNIYDTPELLKKERLMTSTADPELLEDKNEKENQ